MILEKRRLGEAMIKRRTEPESFVLIGINGCCVDGTGDSLCSWMLSLDKNLSSS